MNSDTPQPAYLNSETVRSRRALINCRTSPATGHDYLVDLKVKLQAHDRSSPYHLTIRYVPDRDLLDDQEMREYWRFIEAAEWPSLPALAISVLEDLNNEMIPRWLQVQLRDPLTSDYQEGSMVTIEDKQPGWHNQQMLARISPVTF
ncbi:MAG: hypothetical protein KI792_03805 [Alphaproteobacteria bacterium]|nr:hypothetical protein [Alphaproteobacteria bacterium SS10]